MTKIDYHHTDPGCRLQTPAAIWLPPEAIQRCPILLFDS